MNASNGKISAISISEKKGVQKQNVENAKLIENWGIENDAHAGNWHRQVSLLSLESIEDFNAKGAGVSFGEFAENIVLSGISFDSLKVGTRLTLANAELEITQIGKHCHHHCQIYQKMGDCIMPKQGLFARVLKAGNISVGDSASVIDFIATKKTAAVVTISDTRSGDTSKEDLSGKTAIDMLENSGYSVEEYIVIPDDNQGIQDELINLADRRNISLIITTGGTGFSKRDFTPEATMAVCERNAPGVCEALRYNSLQITPKAMLSRGASVIRKNSLIVNLPGSPKAVRENLEFLLPSVGHGIDILRGSVSQCAEQTNRNLERDND